MCDTLISLCMIVKNEGSSIARCLESVQGVADEIIVVDTGSSDNTIERALKFGAQIIHEPWQGDFAAARNAGVNVAKGKWILFLDGDEALERTGREKLREEVAQEQEGEQGAGCEGFFLQIRNYVGSGQQGATVNPILRLFRNRPEHRFQGRIHEQIASSIMEHRPRAAFRLTEFIIHHYGYQQAYIESKDKVKRNMELLEAALEEEPDNAFYLYNIGVEYLRSARPEQALTYFRRASSLIHPTAVSYAHLLHKYEVRCQQALGRWTEALEQTKQGLLLFPDYTDLLHYKALCEQTIGSHDEALASLLEAMKLGVPPAHYHTEEGIGTFQTAHLLGEILEERGRYEEALLWYTEAVHLNASLTPPLYRLFHLYKMTGKETEIPDLLNNSFRMTSSGAWSKIIEILLQCHCGQAAALLLRDQGGQLQGDFQRMASAEAELQCGRLESAIRITKKLTTNHKGKKLKPQITALTEQLNWLAGSKGPWRDRVTLLLESNGEASRKLVEQLFEDATVWPQLQRLLEAAMNSNRMPTYAQIMQSWLQVLQHQDAPVSASDALLHSLATAADRHLSLVASTDGTLMESAITTLRFMLPREDGL